MSSLVNPGKVRAPRTAGAAIERARLALVPARASNAPRAPFAVLVFLLLGGGVVGLLMFNTHMQQASFYATSLQQQSVTLAAERQSLEMELEGLRDPQRLATAGRKLGMVVPPVPAFVDLRNGRITGTVTPATTGDALRVTLPPHRPSSLNPPPIRVKAPPVAPPATTGTPKTDQTTTAHGPASTGTTAKPGRKNQQTDVRGGTR